MLGIREKCKNNNYRYPALNINETTSEADNESEDSNDNSHGPKNCISVKIKREKISETGKPKK